MNKLKGIIALTRWNEAYDMTIAITILGAIVSQSNFDYKIFIILIANFFSALFIYMINDIEDAAEDAQNPQKLKRNPIANKTLSKKEGYFYTGIVLVITIVLLVYLSVLSNNKSVILVGLITLSLGFLYSYRKIRLKAIPIVDILSHVYFFAGGLFLASFYSYRQDLSQFGIIMFLLLCGISAYGQFDNETRDYETDIKTKVNTTATLIGYKLSVIIKWSILAIAILIFIWLVIFSEFFIYTSSMLVFLIISMFIGLLASYLRYRNYKNRRQFEREINQALILMGNVNLIIYFLKIFI